MKGEIRKDKHKPLKVSCTEEGEATYSQQTVRSHPCVIACSHYKKKKKKKLGFWSKAGLSHYKNK